MSTTEHGARVIEGLIERGCVLTPAGLVRGDSALRVEHDAHEVRVLVAPLFADRDEPPFLTGRISELGLETRLIATWRRAAGARGGRVAGGSLSRVLDELMVRLQEEAAHLDDGRAPMWTPAPAIKRFVRPDRG